MITRLGACCVAALSTAALVFAAEPPAAGIAIQQELRSFNTVATLLHIAAHPDDENTTLITYFARGRGYRTAYLSLTRGDGGQNEIGPEFDEKLGVARTQELLAARKLDGGRQFFTRAIDFGYSKSVDETLQFWDRKEVLGDVVRVIRQFRPDVIVTRFSPTAGGTHGHHTASAVLAVEAFKLAGDPTAYPEQLAQGLSVWQPKRVVMNGFGGRGGAASDGASSALRVNIGGNDPVLGQSFAEIAMHSRRKHITQGFANMGMRGTGDESFAHLGGEPATKDLMDGVDTTWARVPGGAEIGRLAAVAIEAFKPDNAEASVPALLEIRKKISTLADDPVIADKRAQLDRILQACLGLTIESTLSQAEMVPGEKTTISATVKMSGRTPVRWQQTQVRPGKTSKGPGALTAGQPAKAELAFDPPAGALALTHPYWLGEGRGQGIFRVDEPTLIGRPENPPTVSVEYHFEVAGQSLKISDEPVQVTTVGKAERRRRLDVIAPASLRMASDVSIFAPGSMRKVTVEVTAARADTKGTLKLTTPRGWKVSPEGQAFQLAQAAEKQSFTFEVTAPAESASTDITAYVEIGGRRYSAQRIAIDYPHLPLMLLQPTAKARLVSLDVATRGKNVGYLPGAGDDTVEALEQLGYKVTTLAGSDLTADKLNGLDAVVIGVRAFNERKDLKENLPALFSYVENGGTVIAQYNRPGGGLIEPLGPYPLSIAGQAPQQRVTDERAAVTTLVADHPILTTPNRIGPADFAGWVQERGAYFPSKWDSHYVPVLAMSDAGEEPLQSGILIAKHGKGYYVYTGLAFFRQLPAGVPGAYRLFANLVSLGK